MELGANASVALFSWSIGIEQRCNEETHYYPVPVAVVLHSLVEARGMLAGFG